ncbi:hypothetical protein IPG41_04710 [Candidatus Peregrinibacteria bacterium]|nr:MAG: hypothetical protein IPG41_04710 [Candidatus Peregrinibacteria bacterium]
MSSEKILVDAISDPEVQNQFVCVGGVTLMVEDFVNIWNGEFIFPGLSPEELSMIDSMYDLESVNGLLYSMPHSVFGSRVANTCFETVSRLKKFLEIRGMIARYKKTHDSGILSMHRVLSALGGERYQFSTIAEFVSALPGVTPTAVDAALVQGAISEHIGSSDVQVHYMTERGSEAISSVVDESRHALVCSILGVKPKLVDKIPLFILERLAFEVEPSDDDIRELSRMNNIGSHGVVTGIQLTQWITFLGGFGLFAHGITQVMTDLPMAEMEIKVGVELMCLIGVYLMLLYPANARKIAVSLASSDSRYSKMYKGLAENIGTLKDSPYGKSRLVLLREIVREAYGKKNNTEALRIALEAFGTEEEIEGFNRFSNSQGVGYDSPEGVLSLLADYQSYLLANEKLSAELEESLRRATPGRVSQ